MSGRRVRLAIVVSHPIQYQAPLFRRLARSEALDVEVFFLTRHGVAESYDPGFGTRIAYDIELLDGYRHTFVPNWSRAKTPGPALSVANPGLLTTLTRRRADVVLVHGYSYLSHWLTFLNSGARRIPYLLRGESRLDDERGRPPARLRVKRAVLGPVLRSAAGCLAIGSANRAFYASYGVPPSRIFHAPYSVDNDAFRLSGEKGRILRRSRLEGLALDPDLPVVLFAAKLMERKRPLDLLDAVRAMRTPVNLIFVGEGPLRSALAHAAGGSAGDRVRLAGFVNQGEIGEWYGMADVVVLPSEGEPWGLAVNEAMAAGAVPVVSDAVGCRADLVDDGTGAAFPCGDSGALAQVLDRLLTEPGALEHRRREAALRIEQFGVDVTAAGIEEAVFAATTGSRRSG